ncbi:hypothetical protein [Paenibacillus sp. Marseille-Q4541]|uniref:hypothetical protein n=1 Tax=Paenibacillus sp. Marseille-Q4541 TaxID=2831522 RepID=UPI001BA5D1B7|nr:hypothetical protein [Paenibacillus sp. Marseille-Q4541]
MMKKIIAGGILFLGGICLYLGMYLPALELGLTLGGFTTPPGRIGSALEITEGNKPMIYAIGCMILGFMLVIWGALKEELTKTYSYLKRKLINLWKNNLAEKKEETGNSN